MGLLRLSLYNYRSIQIQSKLQSHRETNGSEMLVVSYSSDWAKCFLFIVSVQSGKPFFTGYRAGASKYGEPLVRP